MANSAQAKKRARQAENNRQRNVSQRSAMRTTIKKMLASIDAGDAAQAQAEYRTVTSVIDAAASKGLIHKNKAARHKSRLNLKVKALAS
ncbi:MAG: 30S ribosomal protein S20 [Gammaproteobacteria bacterium]|nr:30S ribosomal protein S20 [Gammaproteobacteria bacterium]